MCTQYELHVVLRELQTGLSEIFADRLQDVILYGSYARGDCDDESDIDVMVLVDLPRNELMQYRRTVSDFSARLDIRYGVLLSVKLQDVTTFRTYSQALPFFYFEHMRGAVPDRAPQCESRLPSAPPKKFSFFRTGIFLSIAKAMVYHQPPGCISSPQAYIITRSVYNFRNDDIQQLTPLMIYNSLRN